MARLVVSLAFLGIYLVIWLIKKAGGPTRPNLPSSQELDRLMAANRAGGVGARPVSQPLPQGNHLLLSAESTYPGLDEALIIVGFMRMMGPPHGEPEAATWRRGTVEIKYTFDAAARRRELSFEGEGWEKAREQVAAKVSWLRG